MCANVMVAAKITTSTAAILQGDGARHTAGLAAAFVGVAAIIL